MLCSVLVGFLSGIAVVIFLLCISHVEEAVVEVYATAGIEWISPTDLSKSSPRSQEGSRDPDEKTEKTPAPKNTILEPEGFPPSPYPYDPGESPGERPPRKETWTEPEAPERFSREKALRIDPEFRARDYEVVYPDPVFEDPYSTVPDFALNSGENAFGNQSEERPEKNGDPSGKIEKTPEKNSGENIPRTTSGNDSDAEDFSGGREKGESERSGESSISSPDRVWKHPFLVPNSRTDSVFGIVEFPRYWLIILLVPAIGGLICGLLVWTFAPETAGEGIEYLIKTYHKRNGIMRSRVVPVKTFASISTIGSGGSAGWEGPLALVGGGIGSVLGRYFKVDARERRTLLLAGAAAGIGAVFQSPFGGALFVAEILYCSTAIELPVLLPCIIASLIGFATCSHFLDHSRSMVLPEILPLFQFSDVIWLFLFALLCIPVGFLFVKTVHEMRNRFFSRIAIPELFKPALGGILLGCVAILLPQIRGGGYEYYQPILDGAFSLNVLLFLVAGKIIATAFTVSSGGSGGLIAPSIFIGGTLGGAFGILGQSICVGLGIPEFAPNPAFFVIVGMGGFLAGIGKIPLTATVLVCDMIDSYLPLVPLLSVGFIQLAIHSPRTSLFREQLPAFEDSPVHLGDFSTDLLQGIRVKDVEHQDRKVQEIPADTPLPRLMKMLADSSSTLFPVIDRERNLIGMLFASDVRSAFHSHGLKKNMFASNLALHKELVLTPEDDLLTALKLMVRVSVDEIPVIDPQEKSKVLFLLKRDDILLTYHLRLANIRSHDDPEETT